MLFILASVSCLWAVGTSGLTWPGPSQNLSDTNEFLVFPRSKSQIIDLPKPSSSQSLLCCFCLMSQYLYSSKLLLPEMSLMDPVPSAWEINAWIGLCWFCAAGDGGNSSYFAAACASSSFAFKCPFFCLEARWMLLGVGAEFREEAACSQCPGSSFLEMPVLCTSLPVAHLGYQKHKAFLFPPHLTILRRVPALGNVVLLQLDPRSMSGFLSLWEGCSSQCKGKVPKGKPVCRVIPDGPSQLAAGSSQLLLGKEGREQLSEGIAAALPNGDGSLGQETPAQQLLALLSCCCVCPMDGFFQWKRFPGDAVWRKSSPGGWQWKGQGKPSRAGLW